MSARLPVSSCRSRRHMKFVSTCIGMALRQLIQQDITFGGGDAA
jgi:hypothetical protein